MGQCIAHRSRKAATPKENETQRNECQSLIETSQKQFIEHSIENDYIISNEVLGEGMSGKVIMVKRIKDGQKCALKKLPDNKASRREIDLQTICSQHPNIVRIIDVYIDQSFLVVLEYMGGGTLSDDVKKRKKNEGEVSRIMHKTGSALAHLHSSQIAHRDIKLANILLTSDGTLKLADFGFAKRCSNYGRKSLNCQCYTFDYVPPEILRGTRYDKSCDMWSLGVVMYKLLSGLTPFYSYGNNDFSIMRNRIKKADYNFPSPEWDPISERAKSLVRRLLVANPNKRLTAKQFMKDPWILEHTKAATNPLHTKDNHHISQEMMGNELARMRDICEFELKPLDASNSRILQRRREQQKQNHPQCVHSNNIQNKIQDGNINNSTYDNV